MMWLLVVLSVAVVDVSYGMSLNRQRALAQQVQEMFNHGYNAYMVSERGLRLRLGLGLGLREGVENRD